jgi:hypothetical protein
MATKKVISHKNCKPKFPVFQTITAWIALDYWNAPGWVWGAVGLLFLMVWTYVIAEIVKHDHEEVDIFEKK